MFPDLSEKPLNTEVEEHLQNVYKLRGQNLLMPKKSLKLADEIVEGLQGKGASYLEIQEAMIVASNLLYSKMINQKL